MSAAAAAAADAAPSLFFQLLKRIDDGDHFLDPKSFLFDKF